MGELVHVDVDVEQPTLGEDKNERDLPIKAMEVDTVDDDDKEKKSVFMQYMEKLGFHVAADHEKPNVPEMSYFDIFVLFLWYGIRAFGGPIAQITMMKEELVVEQKWISIEKFNRVYAIYQALPGPEATELACYFGYVAGGRFGSLLGGLGFLIPGFCLMLLWSYLYVHYGVDNSHVQSSFRGVQVCITAIIFRSTFKLSEGVLLDKKKDFNWTAGALCMVCFMLSVVQLNFFIIMGLAGVVGAILANYPESNYAKLLSVMIFALTFFFWGLYCYMNGVPTGSMIGGGGGIGESRSLRSLFELGLIAGLVTFGGAYTTLPFIYSAAVTTGGWLTQQQFLDAVAITSVMPTPLVTFVCLIGFIGNHVAGAFVMTIGIFLPAMSFTVIGHEVFEALVANHNVHPFLDGVGISVIGLLLVTAFQFVRNIILSPLDGILFLLCFYCLFTIQHKFLQPILIVLAAFIGQILYV